MKELEETAKINGWSHDDKKYVTRRNLISQKWLAKLKAETKVMQQSAKGESEGDEKRELMDWRDLKQFKKKMDKTEVKAEFEKVTGKQLLPDRPNSGLASIKAVKYPFQRFKTNIKVEPLQRYRSIQLKDNNWLFEIAGVDMKKDEAGDDEEEAGEEGEGEADCLVEALAKGKKKAGKGKNKAPQEPEQPMEAPKAATVPAGKKGKATAASGSGEAGSSSQSPKKKRRR